VGLGEGEVLIREGGEELRDESYDDEGEDELDEADC